LHYLIRRSKIVGVQLTTFLRRNNMDKLKYEIIFEFKNANGEPIGGPLESELAHALCLVLNQHESDIPYLAEKLACIKKHIGKFSLTSSVVKGEE
tara:strand:+ start:407 stop:691 length:285 start_codon:yes stop_codon:yes gene_type:complete